MGKTPKLTAFPYGLKMIAGNATNVNGPLKDTTAAKAISFVCLNFKQGGSQNTTIQKGPCPDGLRTQIVFPSCWDGKNLDSPDHQSHVSYPVGGQPDNGDCPASHPVKFTTLFYEFVYGVNDLVSDKNGTLVLANGDTKGWSFHADFISGWNVDTLQAGIDQCTSNLFNAVEKCQPFVKSIDKKSRCSIQPVLQEKVLGTMKHLPGCNAIKNGRFKGAGTCKVQHVKYKKHRKHKKQAIKESLL